MSRSEKAFRHCSGDKSIRRRDYSVVGGINCLGLCAASLDPPRGQVLGTTSSSRLRIFGKADLFDLRCRMSYRCPALGLQPTAPRSLRLGTFNAEGRQNDVCPHFLIQRAKGFLRSVFRRDGKRSAAGPPDLKRKENTYGHSVANNGDGLLFVVRMPGQTHETVICCSIRDDLNHTQIAIQAYATDNWFKSTITQIHPICRNAGPVTSPGPHQTSALFNSSKVVIVSNGGKIRSHVWLWAFFKRVSTVWARAPCSASVPFGFFPSIITGAHEEGVKAVVVGGMKDVQNIAALSELLRFIALVARFRRRPPDPTSQSTDYSTTWKSKVEQLAPPDLLANGCEGRERRDRPDRSVNKDAAISGGESSGVARD
ncbi:hypothetical protein K438DRAFT_1757407 [Mycena galopus ATCC 62051]|nr:hypothetical protein K438DRAFT_1757407 [Mycena galopus ATCC 62051]